LGRFDLSQGWQAGAVRILTHALFPKTTVSLTYRRDRVAWLTELDVRSSPKPTQLLRDNEMMRWARGGLMHQRQGPLRLRMEWFAAHDAGQADALSPARSAPAA